MNPASEALPWKAAQAEAWRSGKTFGICTGCKQVIKAGPYFHKRSVRHVRLGYHNHDAIEVFRPSATLAKARGNADGR